MVNYSTALDITFTALSSPVRRGMLARLAQGWATVGELAQPFRISAPAITKHLRILERAGLIQREVRGREHYLRLVSSPMQSAAEWLADYQVFWNAQFESLADFLERQEDEA
jgi:DNA-binding transcriptional ArsR family regulator